MVQSLGRATRLNQYFPATRLRSTPDSPLELRNRLAKTIRSQCDSAPTGNNRGFWRLSLPYHYARIAGAAKGSDYADLCQRATTAGPISSTWDWFGLAAGSKGQGVPPIAHQIWSFRALSRDTLLSGDPDVAMLQAIQGKAFGTLPLFHQAYLHELAGEGHLLSKKERQERYARNFDDLTVPLLAQVVSGDASAREKTSDALAFAWRRLSIDTIGYLVDGGTTKSVAAIANKAAARLAFPSPLMLPLHLACMAILPIQLAFEIVPEPARSEWTTHELHLQRLLADLLFTESDLGELSRRGAEFVTNLERLAAPLFGERLLRHLWAARLQWVEEVGSDLHVKVVFRMETDLGQSEIQLSSETNPAFVQLLVGSKKTLSGSQRSAYRLDPIQVAAALRIEPSQVVDIHPRAQEKRVVQISGLTLEELAQRLGRCGY